MIYNADCFDVLPKVEASSIDMILCDLPFGVTANDWDKILDLDKLWSEYLRVTKPNAAIVLFANEKFSYTLVSKAEKYFRYKWYWVKNTGTNFFHAERMPIRHVEEILVFSKKTPTTYYPQITDGHAPTNSGIGRNTGNCYAGKSKVNYKGGVTTRFPKNVLDFDKVSNYARLHPNEKPVRLLEYLVKTYTREDELVLDTCAGVMSTAVACKNTSRRFICVEKDSTYYKKGCERLSL